MKPLYFKILFLSALLLSVSQVQSQGKGLKHSVFLIGNTAESKVVETLLQDIDQQLGGKKNHSIIFLGDLTDKNGFSNKPGKNNKNLLNDYVKLEGKKDKCYFIAGDKDWDRGGPKGRQKVKDLEKYLIKKLDRKNAFLPRNGCVGPDLNYLKDDILLVSINSQWFLHPHDKPKAPNTDCKNISELEFWEDLEDILEDHPEKTIIIIAHHPVVSTGHYFGKGIEKFHLIPLIGTAYNSYKKYVGSDQDIANPKYLEYSLRMNNLLSTHQNIIYASAHEYHNEILELDNNIHINVSGSHICNKNDYSIESIYSNNRPGYTRLDFYKKKIKASNYFVDKENKIDASKTILLFKKGKKEEDEVVIDYNLLPDIQADTTVIPGAQYHANGIHQQLMGSQYRKAWTQPIDVEFFDFQTPQGLARPYARGGGLQTNSLKLKTESNHRYALRSVNKNTERALSPLLKKTFYRHLTQDLISEQHPFGSLVVDRYMTQLGILHASPQLYIIPDTEWLGIYQEDFKNTPVFLEEKPRTNTLNFGKDKILKSHQMFRAMYKSHKNKMDKSSYALARVFDMWIGDWDRHEDNWIWAMDKGKEKNTFYPIPKDRDHVFSKWTGLFPRLADKFLLYCEHFDYTFNNLEHLNYKGRHIDRQLANELNLEDWLEAVKTIETEMTDEIIDQAFDAWPESLQKIDGATIKAKLKSRRADLKRAIVKYYNHLAKEVDIIGSNKAETFSIIRLDHGQTLVQLKDKKGAIYYDRTFSHPVTEAINIYGLGGADHFEFKNTCGKKCIKVRIIGGEEIDKITGGTIENKKYNKIYIDQRAPDQIGKLTNFTIKKPAVYLRYNNIKFEHNSKIIYPSLRASSGNGIGMSLDFQLWTKGFDKPEWKHFYRSKLTYYPGVSGLAFRNDYRFKHFIGASNLHARLDVAIRYDQFPFFYGLGGSSSREEDLAETNFYAFDFNTTRGKVELEKDFWRHSIFKAGLGHHINRLNLLDPNVENPYKKLAPADGSTVNDRYEGLSQFTITHSEVEFDFRDKKHFPKGGSLIKQENNIFYGWNSESRFFSHHEISFTQYQSFKFLKPLTLVLRGASSNTLGRAPFFYQSSLGSNTYLRGYTRNRFVDKHLLALNTELRVHVGTYNNVLAPLRFGFFVFNDFGKVWGLKSFTQEKWNDTQGLGIYLTPVEDIYALTYILARSKDNGLYTSFKLGWKI